jgi:hypothetical protein
MPDDRLFGAISSATNWPSLTRQVDPNINDIFWHAKTVQSRLDLTMPDSLPSKSEGMALVESVERNFFRKFRFLRDLNGSQLVILARELLANIRNEALVNYFPSATYCAALFSWHGCIGMAKTTRPVYMTQRGVAPFTLQQRLDGYSYMEKCWTSELSIGNPWTKYGVTLARSFSLNRGDSMIDDWVDLGSPYWG